MRIFIDTATFIRTDGNFEYIDFTDNRTNKVFLFIVTGLIITIVKTLRILGTLYILSTYVAFQNFE